MMIFNPNINYCTFFPEGNWSGCCWEHDEACILATEYKSAAMRLAGDIKLKQCVTKKGHPYIAKIMFLGVRTWAILKGGY